jgi:GntR family uxuAB operon transcriptional repressor
LNFCAWSFNLAKVNSGHIEMNNSGKTSSRLRTYIADTGFKPGDRLPSERDLADRMGIARTSLRRMLGEMEANGELSRHVGRGTFIADPLTVKPLKARTNSDMASTYPAEILEVRLIVEPQIAALAAHRASPSDIEELLHAIARGRAAKSFSEFEEWDATFHRVLVKSSRNSLLISLYKQIDSVRAGPIWGRLKESTLTRETMTLYIAEHESLAQAIVDRDAQTAEREMRRHLLATRKNLIGGVGML